MRLFCGFCDCGTVILTKSRISMADKSPVI